MTEAPTSVLLVDDRPDNLLALEAVLEPLHIEIVRAASGEDALRAVLRHDFALIVLDVQMPGIDGFETARHIRERERTAAIPIIFLTAISRSAEHQLRGYDLGAVDYVAKPFDPDVLRAKARVFIERFQLRHMIERQAELLAARLAERDRAQAALAEQTRAIARANAELERFAGAAAQALRDPLLTATGYLDLVAEEVEGRPADLVHRARRGIERALGVLDGLSNLAGVAADPVAAEAVELGLVLDDVLAARRAVIDEIGATVRCDPLPSVLGERWQIAHLLGELLDNAIAFRSDTPLHVQVSVSRREERWVVTIRDNGIGVPAGERARLFTMFARPWGAGERAGAGLGLATCRRIVERHGGEIWVESGSERGTAVSFTLPAAAA